MLIKLKPNLQKIPRNYSRCTYKWAEKVNLKALVRIFVTLEHIMCLCEDRLTKNERNLFFASLVELRKTIRESAKGQELLVQEEKDVSSTINNSNIVDFS